MAQLPKDLAYVVNLGLRPTLHVGDHVALIDDRLNVDNPINVLGKASDHRIGQVTKLVSHQCVEVRYGSEKSFGVYDQKSLGLVSVTLKEGARENGVLLRPSLKKVGILNQISNFGQGDSFFVRGDNPLHQTIYKKSELLFHITTTLPAQGSTFNSSTMKGGSKRKTIRRPRTKAFFTRFLSRV